MKRCYLSCRLLHKDSKKSHFSLFVVCRFRMKTSHTLVFLCFLLLRTTSGSVNPPNCRLQKGLSGEKQGGSGNYVSCESNVENQDLASSFGELIFF